ncbi:hypothetical protein [Shewanella surugensis]|uniref:Transmembrane anchor protein n=1 Tax=Shewanella surugensis TaxID=212020 RepID=A0ABT0LJ56_9GAMM|nr:hypothetical protein [Shewanella surugensis]MCL1127332.1 hypothetical protein [Shewanella surugensis]
MKTNETHKKDSMNILPVHSTASLIKASIAATLIASILLVLIILPSEYHIDPTGLGQYLGLTDIAEASTSTMAPTQTPTKNKVTSSTLEQTIQTVPTIETLTDIIQARSTLSVRSDIIDIVIPAKKGLEYKLLMDKFTHLTYEWRTDGEPLYFDFHGEPKGDKTGYFESFSITTSTQMKGSLTTPFAGSHGWYWKNQTNDPITVTLSTKGDYTIKG